MHLSTAKAIHDQKQDLAERILYDWKREIYVLGAYHIETKSSRVLAVFDSEKEAYEAESSSSNKVNGIKGQDFSFFVAKLNEIVDDKKAAKYGVASLKTLKKLRKRARGG